MTGILKLCPVELRSFLLKLVVFRDNTSAGNENGFRLTYVRGYFRFNDRPEKNTHLKTRSTEHHNRNADFELGCVRLISC